MEIKELAYPIEQRGQFVLGLLGSIIGTLVGAVVWCIIAVVTEHEAGVIAWALGGLAGFGMALGCRRQGRAGAGVAAAVIAVLGILVAKVMIFGYLARDDISGIRQQLAMLDLPTERLMTVSRLGRDDVSRQTQREKLCFYDEMFMRRFYAAAARYANLPDDELAAAVSARKDWRLNDRFEDGEYVRAALPYYLLDETHPEIWYLQKPVPPEQWKSIYGDVGTKTSALSPEEQKREFRRLAYAGAAAGLESWRRFMSQHLPSGDRERGLDLFKEAYKEALNMESAELADDYARAEVWGWDEGEPWDDPEWLRLRLTYLRAERAWRQREGASADVDPVEGAAWDECYRDAAEGVATVSDGELADLVREADAEYDAASHAVRQRMKDELENSFAGWVAASVAGTFGLFDLLFVGLAVFTAYRVARGRSEPPSSVEGGEAWQVTDDRFDRS